MGSAGGGGVWGRTTRSAARLDASSLSSLGAFPFCPYPPLPLRLSVLTTLPLGSLTISDSMISVTGSLLADPFAKPAAPKRAVSLPPNKKRPRSSSSSSSSSTSSSRASSPEPLRAPPTVGVATPDSDSESESEAEKVVKVVRKEKAKNEKAKKEKGVKKAKKV